MAKVIKFVKFVKYALGKLCVIFFTELLLIMSK